MFPVRRRITRSAKGLWSAVRARVLIRRGRVGVYWWNADVNFGDLITVNILDHYGARYIYAPRQMATLFATGSLLEKVPERRKTAIVGSGFLEPGETRRFEYAKVYAVRGAMTSARLPGHRVEALGDPGLMLPDVLAAEPRCRHRLGLVPHWSEKDHPHVVAMQTRYGSDVLVIDVQRGPKEVVEDILSCELVLSSSLHGIITAHAYGIPAVWLELSGRLVGGGYKFHDYYSSFDRESQPVAYGGQAISDLDRYAWMPDDGALRDKRAMLHRAFRQFLEDHEAR